MKGSLGLVFAVALGSAVVVSLTMPATAATFETFDVPGGTETEPAAMNTGEITGFYRAQDGSTEGFFYFPLGGTFATFQVKNSPSTRPLAINRAGLVTGTFVKNSVFCFLLNGSGKAISCGPLEAVSSAGVSINRSDEICGTFTDSTPEDHGFVWDKNNGATEFDPPGSTFTDCASINDNGDATGAWEDANGNIHAYVRASNGAFTEFDVPGASGTFADAINVSGTVAGIWDDQFGGHHGFVQDALGNITVFDPKGSISLSGEGVRMNKKGVVTGSWFDSVGKEHGFVRQPGGKITSFDVPGATDTFAEAIDDNGHITGSFVDANGLHGFIRSP